MLENILKYIHFSVVVVYCCSDTKSCLTLCDAMDYNPPGSSVHGIFQARMEQVAISYFLLQGSSQSNPHLLHWQVDFFFFFFNPWAIREVHTFLRPLFKVEYIQITCLLLSIVIMSLSSLSQVSERISDKPRVFLRCCSLSLGSRPPQPPAIHSHPSSLQIETPAWIAFMLPCKVYLCQYAPMFVYIHDIPYHLVSDLLSWAITEGLHHSVQQWVDVNKLWPLERGDGMDSGQ